MAAGADATGTDGGMTMGTTSTVALKFVQFSSADVVASRLQDLNVYNNQNEEIGEIEDLVIKDGKTISGVVVSVGGFLGLGDRYVLLDPSSIVLGDKDGTMRAFINTSKEELTNAPEFKYERG
jgi:sporulation protein YlmC with PRC-barrel domain